MNTAEKIQPVIDRLANALAQGSMPAPYDRWGSRLLARLKRPVQVVVTGFEGSGKTTLIEMMSGQTVIGQTLHGPVVELSYGETEQAHIERADGSVISAAGTLRNIECPEDTVRVRQERPDPRLLSQDFVEIGLSGGQMPKRAQLESAIDRADIMIWCSQDFAEEEQQLWSMVPDHVKDHSALVLTKADRLLMRGVLTDTIDRLAPIVAEEFLGLFPVATIQGIAAQTSRNSVDEALWASSGGKHLMDLVTRQVIQGRTADVDQACIFMDRLASRLARMRPVGTAAPRRDIMIDHARTTDDRVTSVAPNLGEGDVSDALLSRAATLLQQHADQMLARIEQSEELDPESILSGCADAIRSVKSLLDSADDGSTTVGAMQEDVLEGEEILMLFQLERSEEAALDAASLLLQIRTELADKLAV